MVTIRVRSLVWFVTGAVLATAVTVMLMQAWQVDAAPGDTDATLVPITPCRLVDTRQPGQTPLGASETRTIDAHGTNGPIAGSQCTIPTDAVGLSMNVTALDATVIDTFITIWQDGVPRPEASSLNPAPGQPPTPNAVTTPISTAGKFNMFNLTGTVQVLVDVNGYYTKASLTDLATRLAAAEAALATNTTKIATNTGNIATNTAGVASLDQREPFVETARDATAKPTGTADVVVGVTLTAPADGHVTVNSTTSAIEGTAGDGVQCSINLQATPRVLDTDYTQQWESAGVDNGGRSQLAGTRVFTIAANTTATYELVCKVLGTVDTDLFDSVLTAIFTPTP